MGAGADGIGQPGQIESEPVGEGPRQRLQIRRPFGIVTLRLGVEREQPGPAIRTLERAGISAIEIGKLAFDPGRDQHLVEQGFDPRGDLEARKQPPGTQQQPIAVDAAVPVEAAEEDRMQRARPERVLGPLHDMVELVRKFAGDVAERELGEAVGDARGEAVLHRRQSLLTVPIQ